ncbi:hypothetical protein G9A89_018437 [Geosiphon pyriformis]|nr:hypothetical protein G9A89_018437 [Geosiphon pyriformis]
MIVHQLIPSLSNQQIECWQQNSGTGTTQNPNSQHYLSLLVTSEDATSSNLESNQQTTLTNNIPPATVTNNRSLAAIFSFELEKPFQLPLFSGAILEEKPITAMYTNAKVDGHPIKLILDSDSAGSIITKQFMNQLSCQVDQTASTRIITADGATKMLIGEIDDFPIEVNGIITLIKVLNDNPKGKQKEELIWETDDLIWTNNEQEEPSSWEEEENTQANNTYILYTYGQQQSSTYCRPKLICIDCNKKLLSMGTCCDDNEEYQMATKFYCHACLIELGKWDNTPCLACGKTLLNKRMWNNISGRKRTCDVSCQYTIFISNWVEKRTPIEAAWRRAVQ